VLRTPWRSIEPRPGSLEIPRVRFYHLDECMISHPKLPFDSRTSPLEANQQPLVQVPSANHPPAPSETRGSGAHLWLRRLGVLVFVFLCATIGVMLMILPWRPEWSENHLLTPYPMLRQIISSGFARGVCTGLGVLNVWIGFWEAIQYREE
jgi:hypothetical protein